MSECKARKASGKKAGDKKASDKVVVKAAGKKTAEKAPRSGRKSGKGDRVSCH